jgi:3-hydroxyacyl-[acyl-carrier-protein] dehydratase
MQQLAEAPALAGRSLNFEEIRTILAHRFPFLMIDRVALIEPGIRIVALKNVSGNEIHFLGHFPDNAILPGVLTIEAMAQAAAILDTVSRGDSRCLVAKNLSSVKVQLLHPIVPGDQLILEASIVKQVEYGVMATAVARAGDVVAAKGELVLGKKQGT